MIGPVAGLLDKFIEDKDQKARIAHELSTMAERHAQELAKAQLEVNKVEAAHKSLFVSGWRPAVGWCCVLGMTGNFMVIPFTNFVLALLAIEVTIPLIDLELAQVLQRALSPTRGFEQGLYAAGAYSVGA